MNTVIRLIIESSLFKYRVITVMKKKGKSFSMANFIAGYEYVS